jgi:hypothetical protein
MHAKVGKVNWLMFQIRLPIEYKMPNAKMSTSNHPQNPLFFSMRMEFSRGKGNLDSFTRRPGISNRPRPTFAAVFLTKCTRHKTLWEIFNDYNQSLQSLYFLNHPTIIVPLQFLVYSEMVILRNWGKAACLVT